MVFRAAAPGPRRGATAGQTRRVRAAGRWAEHEPDNLAAVAEAAAVLGWSANWQRQVGLLAASTICLHVGKPVRQLTEDDFAALLGQPGWIGRAVCLGASPFPHPTVRLAAGLLPTRQPDHPAAAEPAGGGRATRACYRFRQPLIRTEVVRYVQTITTTLRPYTVAGATEALTVFFDYLAAHHPEVTRPGQIERTRHIEPSWHGHGPGPGAARTARDRTMAWCVHQSTWSTCAASSKTSPAGAGHRHRRGDYCSTPTFPRTPDALPRALTPDIDRALMAAVTDLDDAFVRTGLLFYAPPACAWANCSTWNWTACWTSPATAPGCECQSAS